VLLMLHGGPGFDHSIYRPAYSALSDIAQIVYLDHRGNGRSEDGPRTGWNLAQWGDDVHAFCEALGIWAPRSAAWSHSPTPRAIQPTLPG
jgi:proline iminopeptidase